jgi:hypothetical protein
MGLGALVESARPEMDLGGNEGDSFQLPTLSFRMRINTPNTTSSVEVTGQERSV